MRQLGTFDGLANRTMTPWMRVRAAVPTREMLAEMLVAEIRALSGKSQRKLADALGIKQPSAAKMEAAGDMQISTLRKIIIALGGELEIRAKLPGGIVRIKLPGARKTPVRKSRLHTRKKAA